MKLFSRWKDSSDQAAVDRREPLFADEPAIEGLPDDEPVLVDKNDAPAWADVDGDRQTAVIEDGPEHGYSEVIYAPAFRNGLAEKKQLIMDYMNKMEPHVNKAWKRAAPVLGCFGASTSVVVAAYSALAIGALTLYLMVGPSRLGGDLNVAFIGNSYFFVNDLPRVFEKVTGDRIFQDSCLHGSGSILNILKTGNGMYYKWMTQNAMINGVEWITGNNQVAYLYDYGACSVPQLLTGQDKMLSYKNQDGHYINDGNNPCLMNNNYLDYENSYNYTQKWDYVVIIDQSKRMCFDDARQEALLGFNYTYAPLLKRGGSIPVLVQPHAFWSYNVNMTGLENVPTFTSMIMEGAMIYKEFLDKRIGMFQKTKIAPVGNAFLTVWEEDEELWNKLFLEDGIHPSGYGTYLYAMVLHATIYNVVPPRNRVVTDNTMQLFSTARKLHTNATGMPDKSEALTLWKIARRVALHGYQPRSLRPSKKQVNEAYAGENLQNQNGDDDVVYGDDKQGDDDVNQ